MSIKKELLSIIAVFLFSIVISSLAAGGTYEWIVWTDDEEVVDLTIDADREGVLRIDGIEKGDTYGYYYVTLEPIGKGNVTFTLKSSSDKSNGEKYEFTVLPMNIVMRKGEIGSLRIADAVRWEIIIIFLLIAANLIIGLIRQKRENMYSYKIMYNIGALVFVIANVILCLIDAFTLDKHLGKYLAHSLMDIANDSVYFIFILFPLILILAAYLFISNLVLIKKEGGGFRNMLGMGLGVFLVGATVFIALTPSFFAINIELNIFISMLLYGLLAYFECMMIGTLFGSIMAEHHVPEFDKDYIIILGCAVGKDGRVTPLLRGRADRAIWFSKKQKEATGKEITFVASGGKGADEVISEAEAVRNYLVEEGIPEDRILLEDKSVSTYQNMKFSNEIIRKDMGESKDKDAKIAFSTTGYHVFRSGYLAQSQGIRVSGVGSRTKWYFYVNALIREFVANIKNQRKNHVINCLIILIVCIVVALLYFFV